MGNCLQNGRSASATTLDKAPSHPQNNIPEGKATPSKQDDMTTSGIAEPITAVPDFHTWCQTANGGARTTTLQQMEHMIELCNQADPKSTQTKKKEESSGAATASRMLQDLANVPIHVGSLVTWKGIQVGWLLDCFFQAPVMENLRQHDAQLWFIRKVGVIEMVRRAAAAAAASENQQQEKLLSGPFVNHVPAVAKHWDLPCTEYNGQPIVADATTFVSYTGFYTIDYLRQVLQQLDRKEYIWFDVFCVDQFAWTGKSRSHEMEQFRETFMEDLQQQIKNINKTALILQNWNNVMQTLEQMWVLWEIFNTAQAGAELQILLPHSQIEHFIDNCLEKGASGEFDSIVETLMSIDASHAKADNDADRQDIYQRMEAFGWELVNGLVASVIRNWLANQGLAYLEKQRTENPNGPSGMLLHQLGMLLWKQARLEEAAQLLAESIIVNQEQLGAAHENTLSAKNSLATVYQQQGKLSESESMFREIIKLREREVGKAHPNTLNTKNNLALVLKQQGKLSEAEAIFREVLPMKELGSGKSHSDTLATKLNLAGALQDSGKHVEAEIMFREILAVQNKELGEAHPGTLATKHNLALLLKEQGKLDEAEEMGREVVLAFEKMWGKTHMDTLVARNNLGLILQEQGRLQEAEVVFSEVLLVQEKEIGEEHPDTLTTKNNLALVLEQQDKLHEAETLFHNVCVALASLDESHPDLLRTKFNLAFVYKRQGKLSEAEQMFREILQVQEDALGPTHPSSLHTKSNLAVLLHSMATNEDGSEVVDPSLWNDAKEMMGQAWFGYLSTLGSQHPQTVNAGNGYQQLFGSG